MKAGQTSRMSWLTKQDHPPQQPLPHLTQSRAQRLPHCHRPCLLWLRRKQRPECAQQRGAATPCSSSAAPVVRCGTAAQPARMRTGGSTEPHAASCGALQLPLGRADGLCETRMWQIPGVSPT